jgi:spore coat polysaccharide biosynthesis protein SpsF
MGSTRLPGKVLKDVAGDTVLARVVNRTRRATLLDQVVVATSVQPGDDAIAQECNRLGVACFRGDEADVLDRYYQCAREFQAEAVVRITADCPLIEPELIDETVRVFLEQRPDYATNALVITYPRGLDVEVFTAAALARAWLEAKEPYQRAHVTPYLYEEPVRFQVASLTADGDYSEYRWTLDTVEDLEFVRVIYAHFCRQANFRWRQVLDLVRREPAIAAINAHVRQKQLQES